jgi:hypothetical protein
MNESARRRVGAARWSQSFSDAAPVELLASWSWATLVATLPIPTHLHLRGRCVEPVK